MLRVRFAEVSRSALQELGVTFFANGYKNEWFGRSAPPGVPSPDFEDGSLVFSDFLNLFVFNGKEGLGAVGEGAGEQGTVPEPGRAEPDCDQRQGSQLPRRRRVSRTRSCSRGIGSNSVTIMFKEFGIRLNFTPTVLGGDLDPPEGQARGELARLRQRGHLDGFRVPALSTRRTETEVELRDGQTFAIAGLMNNTLTSTMSKIPGIGDIPILGLLFKSKAHQKNQTELVVMITPTIIRRGQMGVSEGSAVAGRAVHGRTVQDASESESRIPDRRGIP